MKTEVLIIIFMVSVMIIAGVVIVSAQLQPDEQLKKFYEDYIAEKIAKCKSKTILKTSKSENLRLTAKKASKKARFLMLNRDQLVNGMIQQDIGQKPYKIEHFLNSHFRNFTNKQGKSP